MKIPIRRGSDKGAALLVLIVLVSMLIFLGFTLWQIWKLLQKLPVTPANQSQIVAGEMLSEFQSSHPNEVISLVTTQVTELTVVQPFEPSALTQRIWRSTNLVNWDAIATNVAGVAWTDPSPPWPCGFYKQEPIGN